MVDTSALASPRLNHPATNTWFRAKPNIPVPKTELMYKNDLAIKYSPGTAAECDPTLVTPQCLRMFYGSFDYMPVAIENQFISLSNFLGEVNNRSDAEIYLSKFRDDAVDGAKEFKQVSIAGGSISQTRLNSSQLMAGLGVEGNLDVQTMLGVAFPIPLTTYSTGGKDPSFEADDFTRVNTDEPYLAWVQYMLKLPKGELPSIVSTSYGDDEQTIGKSYATAVCRDLAQLGARGVTLLFASGDSGVGSNGSCVTNDGKDRATFLPAFPASCPYVTAVGATYQFDPEIAAFDDRFGQPFASGGGFSNYFAQPAYQMMAVDKYLYKNDWFPQYKGLFNHMGRGYPDISAQGVNFSTVWNGHVIPVDGTSAATPAAAGILALVNDALLAEGKPQLGFLNPWLYKQGYKAFNDIQSGGSAGCDTPGFPAQDGWDAVTGFGSPVSCRFQILLQWQCTASDFSTVLPRDYGLARHGAQLQKRKQQKQALHLQYWWRQLETAPTEFNV